MLKDEDKKYKEGLTKCLNLFKANPTENYKKIMIEMINEIKKRKDISIIEPDSNKKLKKITNLRKKLFNANDSNHTHKYYLLYCNNTELWGKDADNHPYDTKEEAIKDAKRLDSSGYPDAWSIVKI